MDLLSAFKQHLSQAFPMLRHGHRLLVAVSGGADSMVLTDLLCKAGFDVQIAHCNFQLRGEESDRDERHVRNIESLYGKKVFVKRFDTRKYAQENKFSIQEAARILRYEWFNELCEHHSISFIATAHHADDNVETALMHFFRGTGLKGLTGIPEMQNNIIRPILVFTKEKILQYAKDNNISFVEDSSNAEEKYTRNFFRNQLIPAAEKIFPNAKANLSATVNRLKQTDLIFQQAIELKRKKLFSAIKNSNDLTVAVAELKRLSPAETWLWELFKPFGIHAVQLNELTKLFDADNGSYLRTNDGFRIIKNRNRLLISSDSTQNITALSIDEGQREINFPPGILLIEHFSSESFKISKERTVCCLDAKHISFPLLLRRWKQGDYFYPLGMTKKKKLSRFFIDQKLSLVDKENVWVLESNKRIVWIVGHRPDERFKITPSTKQVLKIELRVL